MSDRPNTINKKDQPAEIIMALRKPNIGLIIKPTEYLGFHERGSVVVMDGEHWRCFITDHYWRIFHPQGEIETMYGPSKVAFAPDSWLRPLPPSPDESRAKALVGDDEAY